MQCDLSADVLFTCDAAHPAAVTFRPLKTFNELFSIHAAFAHNNPHDLAFGFPDGGQRNARFIGEDQTPRCELKELEQFTELVHLGDGVFVSSAFAAMDFSVLALDGAKRFFALQDLGQPTFLLIVIRLPPCSAAAAISEAEGRAQRAEVADHHVSQLSPLCQRGRTRYRAVGQQGQRANAAMSLPNALLNPLNDDLPSRVRSSTVPISRMYMRTVSCAAARSTAASAAVASAAAISSAERSPSVNNTISVGCLLEHLNAHVVDHLNDVFNLIGIRDVLREVIVDLA